MKNFRKSFAYILIACSTTSCLNESHANEKEKGFFGYGGLSYTRFTDFEGTVDATKVAELKDGQFVGEMSFLTEKPATATCKVEHNAECLVWNQKDFKDLLKRNPSLYFTIQSLLSEQVSNNLVSSSQK